MALPLGWQTDLAVLRHSGAVVEQHADHLVVRSPTNPTFHWGHFVLVTDPGAVGEPERWLARFTAVFPGATHRAVGLVHDVDATDWAAAGLTVTRAPVLAADVPLRALPLHDGYRVRPLVSTADWELSTVLRDRSYPGSTDFARRTTQARVDRLGDGRLTWIGAFDEDGTLAAELGILDCGDGLARFQSVLTHPAHRRRGLVGHLLGVADGHARATYGATTSVIIADEGSNATRLYRAVGLVDQGSKVQAYRFG